MIKQFSENKKWLVIEIAAVTLILLAGAYVRFANLTCLPPGLYPDEAMNTTDGLTTAEAGGWRLFYENNNGREGLYISILGYLLYWFGNHLWIVRFLPALIGTLTLPAVYWLGRRISGRFGAIMALGLMAFSYWHLNFSRIGFRAISMIFFLAWAFALLVEGFYRLVYGRRTVRYLPVRQMGTPTGLWFAIAGLFFGLSLHTYIAVRIVPAVVAVLFILALLFFWGHWKSIIWNGLVTLFFAILTALPIIYDFTLNPTHFTGRTSNVSVLSSPNLARDLTKSVFLTLASFVVYGDQNWRHNYPYFPLVLPVWGIILLLGAGWGIIKLLKEVGKKVVGKGLKDKKKCWEFTVWGFLIAWWGMLLLPSIMTNEGLPHALRSIGAIPPTFLLIGFVVNKWVVGAQPPYAKSDPASADKRAVRLQAIFFGLMVISAVISVYTYFFLWGRSPSAFGAFDYRTSGIGIYLRDTIPQDPKTNYYFITNQDSFLTSANLPVMVEPIRFYTWQIKDRLHYIFPDEFRVENLRRPAKVFFLQDNAKILEEIRAAYHDAKLQKVRLNPSTPDSESIIFAPRDQECFLSASVLGDHHFNYIEIK